MIVSLPLMVHGCIDIDAHIKPIPMPPNGDRHVSALRSYMVCRAARWSEMGLSLEQAVPHLTDLFLKAMRAG